MDPNLFHLDWERTLEALTAIVVLAFVLERAAALLFESRFWVYYFEERRISPPGGPAKQSSPMPGAALRGITVFPLKELLVFVAALLICRTWRFDAISLVLLSEAPHAYGYVLTAGVIAGGSKASIKLFHDVMGIRSSAEAERDQIRTADRELAEGVRPAAATSTTAAPVAVPVVPVAAAPGAQAAPPSAGAHGVPPNNPPGAVR